MAVAYRPSHADATYDMKYGIRAVSPATCSHDPPQGLLVRSGLFHGLASQLQGGCTCLNSSKHDKQIVQFSQCLCRLLEAAGRQLERL